MGGRGVRVEHPDQFGDAYREAIRSNIPTVIDVVINRDTGIPVTGTEHCGQNQWAQRQPHSPLQSLPPTIAPRGTTLMPGGSQKTGRSRACAFDPKQTPAEIARAEQSSREPRIILFLSPLSGPKHLTKPRQSSPNFRV
jgi:hypothetical protein